MPTNPNNPYAGSPMQLFTPEDYEKMKQRQAAAQAAQAPAVAQQAPAVAPPAAQTAEVPPAAQKTDPLQQLGEWVSGLPDTFKGWLRGLLSDQKPTLPPGQRENLKAEDVPVNDEDKEVRMMEERAKKPLADTKGVISKKEKKGAGSKA